MGSFEFLEHTADVALRLKAKDIDELFITGANALFLLTTEYTPTHTSRRTITLEAKTQEDLLVYWLNELISIFYTYRFLPGCYNVHVTKGDVCTISGSVEGEVVDFKECKITTEIKAATYHGLSIEKEQDTLKVDIIFDV